MQRALYRTRPAQAKRRRPDGSHDQARAAWWAVAAVAALAAVGCDTPRQRECERMISVLKPLETGTPTADAVQGIVRELDAIPFQDQPLGVYAKNTRHTLVVLSNVLKLKAGSSPPDGTDEAIRQNLREVRADRADVARYCAP